jgi:hypothetical protein
MNSVRCVAGIVVALVMSAVRVSGQDLDIFRTDDYIPPKELQADDGRPLAFFAGRAMTGFDSDYTHRDNIYARNVTFLNASSNFYYSWFQLGTSVTRFWPGESLDAPAATPTDSTVAVSARGVPEFRVGLETSFYVPAVDAKMNALGRYKLIWNIERYAGGTYENEFGIDIDVHIPGEAYGGFLYTFRPSRSEHVIGFGTTYEIVRNRKGLAVTTAFSISTEVFGGDWRRGVGRLLPAVRLPIGGDVYLNLVYSLTKSFSEPRPDQAKDSSREASVFLSFPLYSRLSRGGH